MADPIIFHDVGETRLMLDGKEATCLGAGQIIHGVTNPDRREIVVDRNTGLNYSRDAVEAFEVYNLRKQKHRPWFFLDLRTGGTPSADGYKYTWYPGCEIHADVLSIPAEIKAAPSNDSETIYTINMPSTIVILDIDVLDQEPFDEGWYKVKFKDVGYLKVSDTFNLRYADPNTAG